MHNIKHFLPDLILVSRAGRLTWHGDIIPQDEIWIKIGGDKGGGSFKMNFQIANTLPMQSTTRASSLALKPGIVSLTCTSA